MRRTVGRARGAVPRVLGSAALAVLLALTAGVGPAAAQQRLQVMPEPGTSVTVTGVLIAAGPLDEAPEQAGLAHLAARSIVDPLLEPLDALGAHLQVEARKEALAFTLVAAPDAWEEASRLLMLALFRDPPSSAAVLRQQAAIGAELRSRAANPADAVARETDAAVYGAEHAWGRPTVGGSATVAAVGPAEVDAFLREHFRASRAVAVVLGPLEPARVRAHLGRYLDDAAWTPPASATPRGRGGVVEREYNSITTWVSAVYPWTDAADEEAMRLLAFRVAEALGFGPTQRSVFNVRADVVPRAGGGELRLQLVVPPGEAGRWADRIRAAVQSLAERPLDALEFDALLRRYRGTRLLELAAPEDRVHEAALRLLTTGRTGPAVPALDGLSAARLQAAARALADPTLVFLGPFFDDN